MVKKLIVILSFAMLITGVPITAVAEEPENTVFGDVNGDGIVSMADLTRLMKLIAGIDVEIVDGASDINSDGKISSADLTRLMKHIAQGETMDKKCRLIVLGEEVETKNDAYVNLEYRYAVLPLTEVFEAAGGTIEWTSETTAIFIYKDQEYFLNLENMTLLEDKEDQLSNVLLMAPGFYDKREPVLYEKKGEIMAERGYLQLLFYNKMHFVIKTDYDNLIITIEKNPHYWDTNS